MKVFRTMGRVVKPLVDFPRWMNVKKLWQNAKDIKTIAKHVTSVPSSGRHETFEQAVIRLGLNEADLIRRQREYWWLTLTFLIFGGVILLVCGYHLWRTHYIAAAVSFVLAGVAFAQAFRNHFWYVQIELRKLGIHWREWLRYTLSKRA